ncbi:D-hexose-6-phosphate mutarotase [Uliginosibacterium sp. H3]|uniref:Putative glucose-6-phosphate 1-epimerase n=1 Tax=Uliginosibacterium silvisoli TaxID=3114758 RepID=A0ABU6K7V2_9RHOO|nr:D-hexose-6-phosphate mutarotase [Uliginosibacterium sp. H3]
MTTTSQRIDYNGLPAVHLCSPDGAEAIVLEHGGHLVSWKPANGAERIYMSPNAVFKEGTPVRGGVPVIFPQFGLRGPLQGHGFARRMNWQLVDARVGEDYALAHLRLSDTPETREHWPHEFALEIAVNISGARLDIELEVSNTGSSTFDFMAALHTYLAVKEVEECGVEGLSGLACEDMLTGKQFRETKSSFTIDQEVDRVYHDTTKPLMLNEPHRGVVIQSENMPDTVIWNPWEVRCAELADMPKDGFRRMLCVEAAVIRDPVKLEPGGEWWGRQTFVAME